MKGKDEFDKEVAEFLDKYTVIYPSDVDKKITVAMLKQYLPERQKENKIFRIKALLKMAFSELYCCSKLQYLVMMLVLLVFVPILNLAVSPYLSIFLTAPIPLFTGFWNMENRAQGSVVELEKTFKFSYYEMLCARMITLTYVSVFFMSIFLLYFIAVGSVLESISIFKIVISGLIPIFIFSTFLLVIAIKRFNNLFAISILAWVLLGFTTASTSVGAYLLSLHTWIYILIIVISIAMFITSIIKTTKVKNWDEVNV